MSERMDGVVMPSVLGDDDWNGKEVTFVFGFNVKGAPVVGIRHTEDRYGHNAIVVSRDKLLEASIAGWPGMLPALDQDRLSGCQYHSVEWFEIRPCRTCSNPSHAALSWGTEDAGTGEDAV